MPLSDRQRAFVASYAATLNAAEAARLAGYSVKTARQAGSRLLQHPEVSAAVSEQLAERAAAAGVKAEDLIARIRTVAFSQPGATWKSGDVLKACELLGKHLGIFEDTVSLGVRLCDLVPPLKKRDAPPAAAPPPPTEVVSKPVSLEDLIPPRPREPESAVAEMNFDPLKHLLS